MNPKEREQLIDDLLEGILGEADFLRLEAEFCVDPAARRAYLERVALIQALAVEAGMRAGEAGDRPRRPLRVVPRARAVLVAGLAAGLALLLGAAGMWWRGWQTVPPLAAAAELKASGFGVLIDQVDAEWSVAGLEEGAVLPPGRLKLTSGAAHLELFSGVSLVLEGPAEFEILSAMEIDLPQGRMRARVPETAHGFRVRTARGEVVDLGTEFALASSEAGAEVQVLEGEIEWHPSGREPGSGEVRLMRKGDALRSESDSGTGSAKASDLAGISGLKEFRKRHDADREERRQAWDERCRQLQQDPRLLVHYRFATENSSRLVPNLAPGPDRSGPGAVVAAVPAEDRWGRPGEALDFSPTGSRVRVHVPGGHGSLTLVCWVRINSLDRLFNSLFLTDGHEVGAPHWQILNDGRLFFSVKKYEPGAGGRRPDKHAFYSPPVWDRSRSGQWMQLAVVHDVGNRVVTQYVDGEVVSKEPIPDDYLVGEVRVGNASIANWSEPVYRQDPEFVVRNLNGAIDEFLLFSAALGNEEIRELHEIGHP